MPHSKTDDLYFSTSSGQRAAPPQKERCDTAIALGRAHCTPCFATPPRRPQLHRPITSNRADAWVGQPRPAPRPVTGVAVRERSSHAAQVDRDGHADGGVDRDAHGGAARAGGHAGDTPPPRTGRCGGGGGVWPLPLARTHPRAAAPRSAAEHAPPHPVLRRRTAKMGAQMPGETENLTDLENLTEDTMLLECVRPAGSRGLWGRLTPARCRLTMRYKKDKIYVCAARRPGARGPPLTRCGRRTSGTSCAP